MILKSTTDMNADNPSNIAIVPNILRYLERGLLRAREATNLVIAVIETRIAKAKRNINDWSLINTKNTYST